MSTVTPRTSPARNEVRSVAPKLIDPSEKVLYGDVWERPGLSKRDRSLVTVAALMAMGRGDQLTGHLERAGWPTAMTAGRVAKQVFEEKKS